MKETDINDELQRLTQQAVALADADLPRYKTKIRRFALVGYLVIVVTLLLLIGLVGGLTSLALFFPVLLLFLIKKKLILLVLPAIWVLLKSLWVKTEAPSGYVLTPQQCPELFAKINAIVEKLQAPKIHQVILSGELNAAMAQTPRLGMFGWYKNTLILGLELLLILTPKQAEAVLAHELGHLSGNHSKFHGWIYRQRIMWYNIMQGFQQQSGFGSKLMRSFFDWYAPRFAAYSFALARINEYEADATAAELTDRQTMADALVNIHAAGPYVNKHYWKVFFKDADTNPTPTELPWSTLTRFVDQHRKSKTALNHQLDHALRITTDFADTHPCLSDRLKALNANVRVPESAEMSAAEDWLGSQFDPIIADFDQGWLAENQALWAERYQFVDEAKKRLHELNGIAPAELDFAMALELAKLETDFGDQQKALAILRACQLDAPTDPNIAYNLGFILSERQDKDMLEQLKLVLDHSKSPRQIFLACEMAINYLIEQNQVAEISWWQKQASNQEQHEMKAQAERAELSPQDSLECAKLDGATRQRITAQLQQIGKINSVWLAQKKLNYYTDVPALVLTFDGNGKMKDQADHAQLIHNAVSGNFTLFVIPNITGTEAFVGRIREFEDQLF